MSQTFRRGGIYRPRWHWWFPWTVTDWWRPRVSRGGDEWCNDSLLFVTPPIGAFVIFWRTGRLRTMPCPDEWSVMCEDQRADYAPCGNLHGGRIRDDAHHHVMTGTCDEARAWLQDRKDEGTART